MSAEIAYINKIRNSQKRAYARAYAAWIKAGRPVGQTPEREDYFPLSFMATQAVQIQLNELLV